VLAILTQQLADRQSLSDPDVARAVEALTRQDVAPESKADFLTALARKGEVVSEIAAFARELRAKSISPPLDAETRSRPMLDVCGTGGDRLNTFNISTTVALILASAGVTVAKHGNRAITSQAGSADVLEALGIRIELEPEEAARGLREHHFAFFFAPKYHPAFREIAPARKLCAARGQRTIFNFLGPLLNPVRPAAQFIGVPRPELCQPIGQVLQLLGTRRGMVVSGDVFAGDAVVHLDELSTLGDNCVAEFYQERGFAVSTLSPRNFPVQPADLADLAGGDRQANAQIVRRLLRGEDRGPKRDAVLLNCAAALFVAEKAASLTEGWEVGAELVDSGKALAKLEELARVWR
jgi:anthranilate phosphoribosyltransferase